MHRRIYDQLLKIKDGGQIYNEEAIQYLRTHFFRQFQTYVDMKELVQNISLSQYHQKQILFQQGEPIQRYYFLLLGRVLIEEKFIRPNERFEAELLDKEGVVGQFFYQSNSKRQKKAETLPSEYPTIILSIDREVFHKLCSKQVDQYNKLKLKLSSLTQISKQNLQSKGLYRCLGFQKYSIGKWVSSGELGHNICYILEGQCLESSIKGMMTLVRDDCLNIQAYFQRHNKNQIKYRVVTSHLYLLTVSFQYLQKLPERFKDSFELFYQSHQTAFKMIQSSIKLGFPKENFPQRISFQRKSTLPRIQFENNSTLCQNKQIYNKVKAHIRKKSKSAATMKEELSNWSFLRKGANYDSESKKAQFLPKMELRQPRGYFNMQVVNKKTNEIKQFKRKDWATYFLKKSKEKQKVILKKKRNKFTIKDMLTTSNSTIFFQSVFKKKEMSQSHTPEQHPISPSKYHKIQRVKQKIDKY